MNERFDKFIWKINNLKYIFSQQFSDNRFDGNLAFFVFFIIYDIKQLNQCDCRRQVVIVKFEKLL